MQAKYIDEWSIVRLKDGRIGTIANKHYRSGFALIKINDLVGVEIRSTDEIEVLVHTAQGMDEYKKLLYGE